jgi:hypothetical protein
LYGADDATDAILLPTVPLLGTNGALSSFHFDFASFPDLLMLKRNLGQL